MLKLAAWPYPRPHIPPPPQGGKLIMSQSAEAVQPAVFALQEATIMRFEIWTESTWPPAFAKTVQGYQARIYSTHAPDEFQASGFSSLIGIIAVDLRRRFAGKLAYGAYVDDILLEQCNHNPEADVEFLSHEDKGLCNTVLAGVFQKPRTKWMACLCCGSM